VKAAGGWRLVADSWFVVGGLRLVAEFGGCLP